MKKEHLNWKEAYVKSISEKTEEVNEKLSPKEMKKRLAMIKKAVEKINKQNADAAKKDALKMMKASGMFDDAIEEGISQEVLDSIADPIIVKFVDDYRRLKQGITKGTAKRKATPAKKAPLKKAKTTTRKKQDKAAEVRARAMSPDSSNEDQMEFLRGLANQSLNL